MDTKHLRYFVCLAEELHFGRAAEKLHIAQPALSIQIKNLEHDLGGALFERNKRKVALTDAGQAMLLKARALLIEMDALRTYANALFTGQAGHITISYSGLAAYTGVMGNLIGQFKAHFPDITLSLEEHDPYEQLNGLLTHTLHVGFMTTLGTTLPPALKAHFLTSSPLRLIFPLHHPLANKQDLTYDDLREESFVVYASPTNAHATAVIQEICGFTPRISHRASTALVVPTLVSAGLGIAVIPAAFEAIARDTGAVCRPLLAPSREMDISLISPAHNASPAVRKFVAMVADSITPASLP